VTIAAATELAAALERLDGPAVRDLTVVEVPCDRPPWLDTGLHLNRAMRSPASPSAPPASAAPVSIGPAFQIWYRIGVRGEIFRGTRDTHTFTAGVAGTLHLASCVPGEWGTTTGALGVPEDVYAMVEGSFSVVLVRWHDDPLQGLRAPWARATPQGSPRRRSTGSPIPCCHPRAGTPCGSSGPPRSSGAWTNRDGGARSHVARRVIAACCCGT
jgi:hypothetical protein